ncbi:type IV secretory system conjugative DNA transfer family protein [Streptomyces triticirhizae]|uniref:type IV secretory system conjugative DNA transfer family protein n=1 Tax=Streptomyces triticirhizae TaxID=2483353 RepID=UPI001F2BCFF9|nr:type IV secretory system conjugative DNA transfer family protein [Streptomyces triticirhizae]
MKAGERDLDLLLRRQRHQPQRRRTSRDEQEEQPTGAWPAPLFGSGGRPGPDSGRAGWLRLPAAHRITTHIAARAYPFLAEGGLGSAGIYLGRDVHAEASFCFDPFQLYGTLEGFTNPNVVLAGVIGTGKSALAKSIALRSSVFGYRVYVPCDPKGEWTPVARALGGASIALGPGLPGRLNPLDAPRPRSVSRQDWDGQTRSRRLALLTSLAKTVLGRDLAPMEHTALQVALDVATTHTEAAGHTLLLGHIDHALNRADLLRSGGGTVAGDLGEAAVDLAHAMRRLVGGDLAHLFDAPSTVAFDPELPILTIDLSRLGDTGETALELAMTCASAWMETALADPHAGRRWVIYDEAWRLMRHLPLLERMQAQWKLSRGLGIANLMIIHRLSDLLAAGDVGSRGRALAEGLLADCSTRVIYRQEADQLNAAATLLGLTRTEIQAISALTRGRGLWKVADRSFITHHILHEREAALFDTDARMTGEVHEVPTSADPQSDEPKGGGPMTHSSPAVDFRPQDGPGRSV